jgi:3D (Asp-Asp-Asp) domain-containing protein
MRRFSLLALSFVALFLSACAPVHSAPIIGSGYPSTESGGASDLATTTATSASSAPSATDTPNFTPPPATDTPNFTATPPTKTPATPPRPTATAPASRGSGGTTQTVWETFYAAIDNDPPGSLNIAYPAPQGRHTHAGGIGTYADPITLAADVRWLPAGTRVYAPRWRKYYIMEDECVECEADWSSRRFHHVDLFMPPSLKAGVLACENAATRDQAENDIIILNPDPNRPVDPTPLYTDAGGCVVAAHQY